MDSVSHQSQGLRFGPLAGGVAHVCVDMQRLFAEDTPWRAPWMARVLPKVTALASRHPHQTVFTRFVPAMQADQARGAWRRYWTRWADITLEKLDPALIELVPELAPMAPPASIIDKPSLYSPWFVPAFEAALAERSARTLVISGTETDICVLATVLGAVDRGYRVVVAADALCSSSDRSHDALMQLYGQRFSQQVETATTADVLAHWPPR
ncbi:MAG: cysteine hydrolase family protein [Hyphomonadaceae bacterium]